MKTLTLAGIGLLLTTALPLAQIPSYTLEEMVHAADQAVYGQIIASRIWRQVDPADRVENYYTTITLQGAVGLTESRTAFGHAAGLRPRVLVCCVGPATFWPPGGPIRAASMNARTGSGHTCGGPPTLKGTSGTTREAR